MIIHHIIITVCVSALQVHSDKAIKKQIMYTVSGPGVDMEPYNIFLIDSKTGYLNVTGLKVDREVTPVFFLTVRAMSGGADVEKPLSLRIRVIDINDNVPVFSQSVFIGAIAELSSASKNSLVMQIVATDADEVNTLHSKIAYKIISQSPSEPLMFIMNQHTGEVFTVSSNLDREERSSYSLVVSGADMDGAAGALSGQCGASINILDVNDNFPMLEYESYSVSVEENALQQGLLFIQVFDHDEMFSDNWLAEFEIVSGNEGGWFVIETDAANNRGILHVVRELNYEALQIMNLGIVVRNRAPFHPSILSEYQPKVTNIAVQVQNVHEGYAVIPRPLVVSIPAGLTKEQMLNYILVKLQMENVDTGEIVSNAVVNEPCYVTCTTSARIEQLVFFSHHRTFLGWVICNANKKLYFDKCISDEPTRTVTTTLTVNVTTPTCPVISTQQRTICSNNPQVLLQADDGAGLSTAPFTFSIVSVSDVSAFTLTNVNGSSAVLATTNTEPRNVTVQVQVENRNGQSCSLPVSILLQICQCVDSGNTCVQSGTFQKAKSVALGPAAIGLLIMGFLALLLAPLLMLLCSCGPAAKGTFVPVADGYDGAYRPWGTEGAKPEDVVRGLESTTAPTTAEAGGFGTTRVHSRSFGTGLGTGVLVGSGAGFIGTGLGIHGFSGESNAAGSLTGAMSSQYRDGGTINTAFVENYFTEKAEAYANEDESRPANDCLLIYDNEGMGSPPGSIGCCSFIDEDLDDSYLDNLGPKFKTLAEICSGKTPEPMLRVKEPIVVTSIPTVEPNISFSLNDAVSTVRQMPPAPVTSSTYVSESLVSSSNLQPAKPIPEPGNVLVTETYTTSGPSVFNFDSLVQPNILVTERVVGPTPGMRGAFPEISDGSNVIVTERVICLRLLSLIL
uniref:SOSS complex subunit B1 n=1 Tax=Xenopus tropicalis TaxID=8364 RepID=F7ADV1_XENTR